MGTGALATTNGALTDRGKPVRARRWVHGSATIPDANLTSQREVIDAFLTALRGGDFDGLVAVLDPDDSRHAWFAPALVNGRWNLAMRAPINT